MAGRGGGGGRWPSARPKQARAVVHRLNDQAWQFLQSNINGSHDQETIVSSQPTICEEDGEPDRNDLAAQELTGRTPESLSNGTLSVNFGGGDVLTEISGARDPDNPNTDPLAGAPDPCRSSTEPPLPLGVDYYRGQSQPLPDERTYVGLGEVEIPYTLTGAVAEVNARVWDIAPNGGPTLLMTRGTYRLELGKDPSSGTLRLPLFGNQYQLKPGHRLRLDLQEVDSLTFRHNNTTNTFDFSNPTLKLPTRQSGDKTLTGVGN